MTGGENSVGVFLAQATLSAIAGSAGEADAVTNPDAGSDVRAERALAGADDLFADHADRHERGVGSG